jgi:hypothetical protein
MTRVHYVMSALCVQTMTNAWLRTPATRTPRVPTAPAHTAASVTTDTQATESHARVSRGYNIIIYSKY